jgi:hypothetical protein
MPGEMMKLNSSFEGEAVNTCVGDDHVDVPSGLLDFGRRCCVVGFVAGRQLEGVHVGVLCREILERLSSRVACSSKDNCVRARREGGGEGETNATVGSGNLNKYRGQARLNGECKD